MLLHRVADNKPRLLLLLLLLLLLRVWWRDSQRQCIHVLAHSTRCFKWCEQRRILGAQNP